MTSRPIVNVANAVIVFAAVAALASVASVTRADTAVPNASLLDDERQRIDLQRKQIFAADYPATRGQPALLPSDSAVKREMERIARERKDLFDAEGVQVPTLPRAPNAFPNIVTPAPSQVDIEAIAQRYGARAVAGKTDALMIFASFTLPPASLKRIVAQANRVGATVVLRGFKDNSVKATALAIQALGEAHANVVINPNAYTQYRVDAVPLVLLATADAMDRTDAEGCALPASYASVTGDVSLDYALDEIARRDPRFEPLAKRYLRQLRGRL